MATSARAGARPSILTAGFRHASELLRSLVGALQPARSTARVLFRFTVWMLVLTVGGSFAVAGSTLWALQDWPFSAALDDTGRPTLLFEAQDGQPLGRTGTLRLSDATQVPEQIVAAVLSIEDRRFYNHIGIDPVGIARALHRNIEAGRIVEGGSTITQQLIKIKYLGHERRFARKLREAVMSVAYERRHSKDEILLEYLNSVYLGEGAYGMPAAARLYFNKTLSELTLAEAAMLAGIIKAPSLYNPVHDLDLAQARAKTVIDAMHDNGMIDAHAASQAKMHPATLDHPAGTRRARSWFTTWVAREAGELAGNLQTVRVRTTLMPKLQRLAEQVVSETLAKYGARLNASQAALVAVRPDGAVVAMVGGRNYDESQFNRATAAHRHPGSAFKLFVYLAALRQGYGPNDLIEAGPVSIRGWKPENYSGQDYRAVSLAESFARSINTAAVHLAMQVGLDNVIDAARDLGIEAPLNPYPSLALGATGVSLVDLTGAYASVRAGRRIEPWGTAAFGNGLHSEMLAISNAGGGEMSRPVQNAMIALLHRVVESGTGRRAALNGFAAGKTGTSQDYRDAWFVGFNDTLTTGVWVGNDDGRPMKRVVGGTLPAMIWQRFMAEATKVEQEQRSIVARLNIPEEAQDALAQVSESELEEPSSAAGCDIAACSRAFRSFRASDCTYQPYDGPRRLCTRGSPGEQAGYTARAESVPARRQAAPPVRRHRPRQDVSPASY